MKLLTVASSMLGVGLLFASAALGQSQATDQPKFQVEIQATPDGKPSFVLRNSTGMVLVACRIQFSVSSEGKWQTAEDWDPVAGIHTAIPDPQGPLEPGRAMMMFLPHATPGPLPDKVEVITGIWADGETFGDPHWVRELVDRRASLASAYTEAISILQRGVAQSWTRDQYMAALNSLPASDSMRPSPYDLVRTAVALSATSHAAPEALQHPMQDLSAYFTQKLDQLRPANPSAGDTTSP
jgi:hypothetical protein